MVKYHHLESLKTWQNYSKLKITTNKCQIHLLAKSIMACSHPLFLTTLVIVRKSLPHMGCIKSMHWTPCPFFKPLFLLHREKIKDRRHSLPIPVMGVDLSFLCFVYTGIVTRLPPIKQKMPSCCSHVGIDVITTSYMLKVLMSGNLLNSSVVIR